MSPINELPTSLRAARDAILAIENVVKQFPTAEGMVAAVDGISFTVRFGEFLSVIGPSGCGKSTLFNIIGGLIEGHEGRVSGRRRDASAVRIPRSAWCSRKNRPSLGAP